MIESEGALESVSGDVPSVPVAPNVVYQHVDRGKDLKDLIRQPTHVRLGRQVRDEHVHQPAAGCADLARRILGALAVAACNHEVRTEPGQAQCSRLADARGGTGDQHGLAGHRSAVSLSHVRTPSRCGERIGPSRCALRMTAVWMASTTWSARRQSAKDSCQTL